MVVEEIYWFGGFGDRSYIGWISAEEWRGVTEEEVADARLVGEEGWDGEGERIVKNIMNEGKSCGPKCRREKAFQNKASKWR